MDVGAKASGHTLGFAVQWRWSFGTRGSKQHLKEDMEMLPDRYGFEQRLSLTLQTSGLLCISAPLRHSCDLVTSLHHDLGPLLLV